MGKFSENSQSGIYYDRHALTVGALASLAAATSTSKQNSSREQGFRILKSEWYATLKGYTDGEGPWVFGLCQDLTAAQITAVFDAVPQFAGDGVENFDAMRPLWILGIMSSEGNMDQTTRSGEWKPKWSFPEGVPLKAFIWNASAGTLTTGATLILVAKNYGVWLRD